MHPPPPPRQTMTQERVPHAGCRVAFCSMGRTTILPAALLVLTPPLTGLIWYTNAHLDGSVASLADWIGSAGIGEVLARVWGPIVLGSPTAWTMIAVLAAAELAFMRVLPGRRCEGSLTPAGNIPVYKANGFAAFVLTVSLFIGCSFGLGLFSPTIIFDHFGELIGALNITGIALCLGLYHKGRCPPPRPD